MVTATVDPDVKRAHDLALLAQFVRIEPRGWESKLWFETLKSEYPKEYEELLRLAGA
jgi:hypothetical protein